MSKRNFILLIIALALIGSAALWFFFAGQSAVPPEEDGPGINFFTPFNPFSSKKTETPAVTEPVDISGGEPILPEAPVNATLMKVSSMPIAGFAVFQKERLKDVPVVVPVTPPTTPYDFGTITLKTGSSGDAVKELQRFLNDTLDLKLEADGIFDEEISTAMKDWQGSHNIVADGIVGAKTKAIMYASVNQKTTTTKPAPPLTEFVPAVRYVDRATGNIYQTFADKIEERKFSTTTIPRVYEAFFGNKGESVIMRYLKTDGKTIDTFIGNLPKEFVGADTSPDSEVKGTFLPKDVKDISMSPGAGSMFYLFDTGESMIGTTLNLFTNKKVQVFDSPFTEWLSLWPNTKLITLTTKPASGILGYMYGVDPTSGKKNLTKILGGINGLTTLAGPTGKLVLYSSEAVSLNIYHTDTKITDAAGVRTLPEKCVWGSVGDTIYCAVPKNIPQGAYPDAWYQGEVSFSDEIWKIDLQTGTTTMLLDPMTVENGEEVDAIKLALDEGENYLFFVNKKDSFLWKMGLK